MNESKKHENVSQSNIDTNLKSAELRYEMTEKLSVILRKYFGSKSFVNVADVIELLKKNILSEKEINIIVSRLGDYPYDEVVDIFNLFHSNVKQLVVNNECNENNFSDIESEK